METRNTKTIIVQPKADSNYYAYSPDLMGAHETGLTACGAVAKLIVKLHYEEYKIELSMLQHSGID